MSTSQPQPPSSHGSRRASAIGAVTGLAVAAAIVVPSAIAAGGQSAGPCAAAKSSRAIAASRAAVVGAPGASASAGNGQAPFLAAVARLEQAGTIDASQARVLDADIQSGSINPKTLIGDGVLSVTQMRAVNGQLVAIKMGMAAQVHASSSGSQSGTSTAGG